MIKKYISVLIFLSLLFPFYAQEEVSSETTEAESPMGDKSSGYRQVNGLENWTYDYDISGLEDGKYNLIIRSSDAAGNVSMDGPINIFVDSESDLPLVSISSPSDFMRVGGDIFIVGTASDDDEVDYVEVRIDDGAYIKSEGAQFWSSFLDISDIPDGRHSITARATDTHGLQGTESSLIINIDKNKPEITIDSHQNGEILSGKKTISGFVTDANGVSRLEYSLDGEIYNELKLSGKPVQEKRNFSLKLNTEDDEGGTSYILFRTEDGTGSDGSTIFVYYADNEKPQISIISPTEDEELNGFITVTGTVSDEVGIASFSSRTGNDEEDDFSLISGNPYWSRTFDFRGEKAADITFKAVDLSGNIEEYRLRLKLDPAGDIPRISLLDFEDDQTIYSDKGLIKGIAADDEGIERIEYSIDENQPVSIESLGPFLLDVGDLSMGKHVVEIKAFDISDVESDTYKYSFFIAAPSPQIVLSEYTTDKTVDSFSDGIIFQQGKTAKISGLISGGEGVVTITYTLGEEEGKPLKASKGFFSLNFPKKTEIGGHDLHIKATDSLGREALFSSRIYFAAQPGKDEIYVPVQDDRPGIYLKNAGLENDGIVNISTNNPLSGYVAGDTISTVVLDPPQEDFSVTKNGQNFTVSPLSETDTRTFTIKITTDSGQEYSSESIQAASDFSAPLIAMDQIKVPVESENISLEDKTITIENGLSESSRIGNILILSGSFSDVSTIESTKISFSGSADSYGVSPIVKTEFNENQYTFNEELDLVSIPDGEHFVTVEIEDSHGNTSYTVLPFLIDRSAPEITLISPAQDVPVEGIISVSGYISDFNDGGDVYFSENGIDFNPVDTLGLHEFSHNIDLSKEGSNPEMFLFKVIDKARNQSVLKPNFLVDIEADQPKVSIEIPIENSTIRGDFALSGLVFDDDSVASIYYSVDGSEFIQIEGNFYYNIPMSLSNISDGRHSFTVKAEDAGGFMSEEVTSSFLISKAEPVSELVFPNIDAYTKNTIILQGQTYDENGVDKVYISYDNGITFNEASILDEGMIEEHIKTADEPVEAEGELLPTTAETNQTATTAEWIYSFDTRLPGDGTHSLLIKSIDGAGTIGISSTILNIDNTVPEIKLDSPSESDKVAGTLILDGKVFDGTSVKSVVSELNALDGKSESLIWNIPTDGVFRDILDVSEYIPGMYNLNITVTDFADNSISETRNLTITSPAEGENIDLYFPEEGKELFGPFLVEGKLQSNHNIKRIVLMIDNSIHDTADIDDSGLFSFNLTESDLADGKHIISVMSADSENSISSNIRNISYNRNGPWVSINNMSSGQFVSGRPLILGSAGYSGFEDDKSKAIEKVEISLDNGKVFNKAKGRETWEFRLETYDLSEGENQLLVRAVFKDGSDSVTKMLFNIDETAPVVELFIPDENKRFNETVALVGVASDENNLDSVEVLIRKGGKESYEVPSFIQGLYVDVHALGATYGELGVGLSFFDDVVKLQAQVGLAPPGRFTGIVFGAKLLANVLDIPFSYFFGYDWEFFSMSVAVGANFNYFTMSEDSYSFDGDGVVLGSVLLQYEFAKFELKNMSVFNSYSLYVEGSLWFISSDVEAGVSPALSFGARVGIF